MRIILTTLLTQILLGLVPASTPADTSPGTADRRMVLTFDDLPAQRASALPEERIRMITRSLLEILEHHQVPAIGFVNESKLYQNGQIVPGRVALLEQWLEARIELGNHTFSHPDLHVVSLEEFETDLLRGDDISRPLAEARQTPYRYFRHPFLHTGRDLETKHSLEHTLDQLGYRVAPVTIDNSEWIFARAYDEALDRQDEELQRRLGAEYVQYMLRMVSYYEDQSRGLFDREISQILLVHANALNAHYLDAILAALRQRGYRFIDLDLALTDPAFQSADTYVGPGGITWLHRWALTRGVEGSFFKGEPTTAQWVQDVAGVEE